MRCIFHLLCLSLCFSIFANAAECPFDGLAPEIVAKMEALERQGIHAFRILKKAPASPEGVVQHIVLSGEAHNKTKAQSELVAELNGHFYLRGHEGLDTSREWGERLLHRFPRLSRVQRNNGLLFPHSTIRQESLRALEEALDREATRSPQARAMVQGFKTDVLASLAKALEIANTQDPGEILEFRFGPGEIMRAEAGIVMSMQYAFAEDLLGRLRNMAPSPESSQAAHEGAPRPSLPASFKIVELEDGHRPTLVEHLYSIEKNTTIFDSANRILFRTLLASLPLPFLAIGLNTFAPQLLPKTAIGVMALSPFIAVIPAILSSRAYGVPRKNRDRVMARNIARALSENPMTDRMINTMGKNHLIGVGNILVKKHGLVDVEWKSEDNQEDPASDLQ